MSKLQRIEADNRKQAYISNEEVEYLIDTIKQLHAENERLEKFIENLQVVHFMEFQREKATVERYKKALEFYADSSQYIRDEESYITGYPPEIMTDRGFKATEALETDEYDESARAYELDGEFK